VCEKEKRIGKNERKKERKSTKIKSFPENNCRDWGEIGCTLYIKKWK
jgi:hypothetical protein